MVETKRAVLLSAMGAKAYKVMRNLISLINPSDKSFEELVEIILSSSFRNSTALQDKITTRW